MDEAERAFRDALHRVDSVHIPVPLPEVGELRASRGRWLVAGRWLAAAAALAMVAGLGVWALTGRGGVVPAVPAGVPTSSAAAEAPVLVGATWVAIELPGQPVEPVDGQVPYLRFEADSTFSGADPCNGVGGTYRLTGNELVLSRTGFSTAIGCNVPQQQQFAKALGSTRRASRAGDTLELFDAAGVLLGRFRATVAQGPPGTGPTPSVVGTPSPDPNLPTQAPEATPTIINRPAPAVRIRIRNASSVDFTDVYAVFPGGTKRHYGPVRAGQVSRYELVLRAYSYSYLKVTTADRSYVYQPIDYVGETELPSGHYGYVLKLVGSRIDLQFEVDD